MSIVAGESRRLGAPAHRNAIKGSECSMINVKRISHAMI
jgi:hypothetical protein